MADSKLPAIQFYPGDWLKDPVAGCSLAAQGLWLRMMFIMHESEHYGYLSVNGSPIPSQVLARRTGCDSLGQFDSLLAELESAGIPSRTSDRTIFSRRMVRDHKERQLVKVKWRQQKREQRQVVSNVGACPQNVRAMSAKCPPVSSSSSSSSIKPKQKIIVEAEASTELFPSPKITEREIVHRIWNYYLDRLGKNPAILSFSEMRRQKGTARFREAVKKAGGDQAKAEALMRAAIDALAGSEFHTGGNDHHKHYDSWEKNLFPSLEKFESWLEKS